MLHIGLRAGSTENPRIVLIHGFTQTGGVWVDVAGPLSARFEVIAPDLPGHGQTSPEYDDSDLWQAAELIAETCGEATYVGYSMGGRILMHLAIRHPELVRKMALVGAKCGYDDPAMANRRRVMDETLARRIEAYGQDGLEAFIDDWLRQPFNAGLHPASQHREERLTNRAAGLVASIRHCGTGQQKPLWDELAQVDIPSIVIWAENDPPEIISDGSRLLQTLKNALAVPAPGAPHPVPFVLPLPFASIIEQLEQGRIP